MVPGMTARRALGAWTCILVLLLAAAGEGADGPIKSLLADKDRHDRQVVTLAGTMSRLDVRVSRRGNAYYTFTLDDGSGRVTVFSFGQPSCPAGSRVRVEGEFRRAKEVSGHTFYDQIDARRVGCM